MANDPLSQFRKTPTASNGGAVPPTEADEYAAFGTKDRVRRLRIRSAAAPVNAPGYNILLNVVSDGQDGSNFILVYSVLLVLVRGRNLQKMVFAIENEMADYIQEFDPEKWQKPTDATAPLIESIEIKVVESRASNTDTQH
jgi:hypothetical protein